MRRCIALFKVLLSKIQKGELTYLIRAIWLANVLVGLLLVLPLDAAGAVLGSSTALFIALVAYPWQKNIDRQLSIDQELRLAAARYLKAEASLLVACQSATRDETRKEALKAFDEAFSTLTAELKLMFLMVPKPVATEISEHFNSVGKLAFLAAYGGTPEERESAAQLVQEYNSSLEKLTNAIKPSFGVRPRSF
nr:hypothetical protein [Paracoccus saliphilus]